MRQSKPSELPSWDRLAFSSLATYSAVNWPGYKIAQHHKVISEHLEAVERGDIPRLMITMPPRHGKSMLASEFFPAWYLGRNPDHYVIAATYAQELADDFGRKVRNQISDPLYQAIFPGVGLKSDSTSSRRFHVTQPLDSFITGQNGAYFAVGVGGPLTGRGAHLLLIDDPVKNREEADSELIRRKTKDWYTSTAYTRLMPGGRVVIIQCLTGDTLITLASGIQKRLDTITTNDHVLSWDGKRHVESRVSAVINNGIDQTFLIKTKGTEIRANARHPFLVLAEEGLRWIRTKDLRNGMRIVRQSAGLTRACPVPLEDATSWQNAGECAATTTQKPCGQRAIDRLQRAAKDAFRIVGSGATALISRSLTACLPSRAVYAPYALPMAARGGLSIGSPISFPTITTRQGQFAASYATTATGSRDELEIPPSWNAPSSTCEPDTDEIISVAPHGFERVYDLSVADTHNFVANGLWTHNTRWHEDDLSGWLLAEHKDEGWVTLDLPAINDDGEALWPEQYPIEALENIKRMIGARDWSALYQQRPAPEEGDYFRAEWLHEYEKHPPRETMRIYGASDYAVTSDGGDYTVHIVVGVDPEGRMWVLDIWRKQSSSDVWVESWCDLVLDWRPAQWGEETGQINAGVGPFLVKRAREKHAYTWRRQFASRHDKAVRAQSIRGRMAMDGLMVPRNAPWLADFRHELLTFPAGKHDDQVDALGLIGQLLDLISSGREPKEDKPKPKEHILEARPDGGYSSNMNLDEAIQAMIKRRRAARGD